MHNQQELKQAALKIRLGIVQAVTANHGGHIGGSMDLADMLAVVYSDFMRIDPDKPDWPDRDFMVFSKGHAGPALYSSLAMVGMLPYERLNHLNNPDSVLPGHCDRVKVPGVDATTGSLGQGLSIACGIAKAAKIRGTDQHVFCITGDGESAEGQIWEAAQYASHYHLDNLIAFLDWNKMQIDGSNDEVMALGDPVAKYRAFGWYAELVKGTDLMEIQALIAKRLSCHDGKPTMIVLDTVKGQGAECIMKMSNNHCIGVSAELSQQMMAELREQGRELGMEV